MIIINSKENSYVMLKASNSHDQHICLDPSPIHQIQATVTVYSSHAFFDARDTHYNWKTTTVTAHI